MDNPIFGTPVGDILNKVWFWAIIGLSVAALLLLWRLAVNRAKYIKCLKERAEQNQQKATFRKKRQQFEAIVDNRDDAEEKLMEAMSQ